MKTGQLSVIVIAIFLLTDTCTGSKSTRNKGNYETLLLFNPRSDDPLYAFLANSPGRDGGFALVDSKSERSQYPSFFAQNKNYINPKYSRTEWGTNPPKQMMVEVNTYEDNTADVPFVTQRLHQQIFDAKDSTVYSWFESDRALDRRTAAPFELSITAFEHIFAYGIEDNSGGIMQWVISLYTRDSSQNRINVLLKSKSNTPPALEKKSDKIVWIVLQLQGDTIATVIYRSLPKQTDKQTITPATYRTSRPYKYDHSC